MNVFFASLGCDKNLSDAEKMLYLLDKAGMTITDDETDADAIVVNTCCFIGDALEESIETILSLAKQKETGRCKTLIVTGCIAERYKDEVFSEMPEVDAIVGTNAYDAIVAAISETLDNVTDVTKLDGETFTAKIDPTLRHTYFRDLSEPTPRVVGRLLSTGGYYAYLKIAEGCDKNCTYCVIPSIRGTYRSIPMDDLLDEAKRLVSGGVRELILVAQETTLYGTDFYGRKSLAELLRRLDTLDGISWIRLLYCYPEEVDEPLLYTMRDLKHVVPYLDIPVQHASDDILRRMGRRTNRAELIEKIAMIREILPDISLRTTVMTGFPGETEEDHEILLDFIREIKFDRLGAFCYSPEDGMAAAAMPNQINQDLKNTRYAEIMETQQEINFALNKTQIGKTVSVMIDGRLPDDDVYIGRTYRDAPEVDGQVFIENIPFEPLSGRVLNVRITGVDGYDLIGEYDEFTE